MAKRGRGIGGKKDKVDMMRAQILKEPKGLEMGPLELVDMPIPEPKRGQVRIKVCCCGICLTDKHICEGELLQKKSPLIPGHQVVGVIDKSSSTRFEKNERVGAVWLGYTCQGCRFCKMGMENLCERARFTGWDFDGGFAEYMIADEEFIHRLPSNMENEHIAPLLCAGVIGYRSLRLTQAGSKAKIGLYGFGNSAHIVCQIAKHYDMEVYAFARGEAHRLLAKKLGAKWVGTPFDTPAEKLTHAIIFAPQSEMVIKALQDLDRGGKIAINAIHMNPITSLSYADLYYEKTLQSVTHGTRKDAEDLFSLMKECPIQTEVELFSLDRINEALLMQKQSKMQAAGVITFQ
ncbi:MAG: zinc-dependent alcohol dehydrogenase family protein [Chlamydiae bacterium]|nr:zinc-dependent alcohol dehydrogenase family protein [Chlamydiota bacterium]